MPEQTLCYPYPLLGVFGHTLLGQCFDVRLDGMGALSQAAIVGNLMFSPGRALSSRISGPLSWSSTMSTPI